MANREVQVRQGNLTDIYVDAITQTRDGEFGTVSVIIEVKGCWHPEVSTAMKTQLIDQYLSASSCSHGIYVVGWFLCPQWDDEDCRKKRVTYSSINDMRDHLEAQASELSSKGISVRAVILDVTLS